MESQVIDSDAKASKPSYLKWLALILLWAGVVSMLLSNLYTQPKVIAALALLSISTVASLFNYTLGVKFTFFTIILGVLKLIDFFPVEIGFDFRIGSLETGVNFILAGIAGLHYRTNDINLRLFLKSTFGSNLSREDSEAIERMKIDGYKKRYSKKNNKQLELIRDSDKYTYEAQLAAEELLNENKNDGEES